MRKVECNLKILIDSDFFNFKEKYDDVLGNFKMYDNGKLKRGYTKNLETKIMVLYYSNYKLHGHIKGELFYLTKKRFSFYAKKNKKLSLLEKIKRQKHIKKPL